VMIILPWRPDSSTAKLNKPVCILIGVRPLAIQPTIRTGFIGGN
jgi:hypothetical protein